MVPEENCFYIMPPQSKISSIRPCPKNRKKKKKLKSSGLVGNTDLETVHALLPAPQLEEMVGHL